MSSGGYSLLSEGGAGGADPRFSSPDTNVIDPASELILIDNALNFAGNHNGGDVRFGTDGYL